MKVLYFVEVLYLVEALDVVEDIRQRIGRICRWIYDVLVLFAR